MENHIKVSRVHNLMAWFYAVSGIVWAIIVFASEGARHGMIFLVVGGICLGLLALVHGWTASACRQGREVGRWASIIISVLLLFGVPIGTILGIYLLVHTWRPFEPSV